MLDRLVADAADAVDVLADREVVIGGAVRAPAIFSAPQTDAFGVVDGTQPAITIAESVFPEIVRGEVVDDAEDRYLVVGVEPDGHGLVTLKLELQA